VALCGMGHWKNGPEKNRCLRDPLLEEGVENQMNEKVRIEEIYRNTGVERTL
jgi:hypothetical protein